MLPALDDKTGTINNADEKLTQCGLVGAAITELVLREKVEIQGTFLYQEDLSSQFMKKDVFKRRFSRITPAYINLLGSTH